MNSSRFASLVHDVLRAAVMMVIAVAIVLAVPRIASAHAVLLESTPVMHATVSGGEVPVTLKFNSRVDGARSSLSLAAPGGVTLPLPLEKQDAPDTLTAHASQLKPGKYAVRWQVLAVDGHVTRGQVLFEVK